MRRFPIAKHRSHFGVATYTNEPSLATNFGVLTGDPNAAVENIGYLGSNSNIFSKTPPYIHKVLVAVVGERHTVSNIQRLLAMKDRLIRENVFIYIIAVGDARPSGLSQLGWSSRYVFRVPSFRGLLPKAQVVGRAICQDMVSFEKGFP